MAKKTQTGTATGVAEPTKKKNQIVKPAKVLRENLQQRKELFEGIGWAIKQANITETWSGSKTFENGTPATDLSYYKSLAGLFEQIKAIETMHFVSEISDPAFDSMMYFRAQGWNFEQDIKDESWAAELAQAVGGAIRVGTYAALGELFNHISMRPAEAKIFDPAADLKARKKEYEAEGWRFTENPDAQPFERWTATNGSPAFPKFQGENLASIFEFIEKEKSENGERLRRFLENHRAAFDKGELPADWQAQKTQLEARGWQFDYDAEKSQWSALHEDFLGCTGVNDFGRLIGIVERNSNLIAEPPAEEITYLPAIDVARYENAVIESGGEYDPEAEEGEFCTPDEARSDYFHEIVGNAQYVRELEAKFSGLNEKEQKKAKEEIERKTGNLHGGLIHTHNFFGEESAAYLRGELKRFGFEYDDEYREILKSAENIGDKLARTEVQIDFEAKIEIESRREKLERNGWQIHENEIGNFSGKKKFAGDAYVTKMDNAVDVWELINALEAIESKYISLTAQSQPNNNSVELPIISITVSDFSPQSQRRRRFKPEQLAELAESIKQQGLINAITVRERDWQPHLTESGRYGAMLHKNRPDWALHHIGKQTEAEAQAWCDANRYEIVAGERRFEAAKLAGLDTILCFVKELSDEQALEIQLQENLQRVDVDPLDEAFSYKYLMENQKMSVADLVVKFGKTEKYIGLRLKLNLLIPEVLQDIADGHLPLGHAIEIAKFDEAQQPSVLKCAYETSGYWGGPLDKNKPRQLKSFIGKVRADVLLELKSATFSTKATNLRPDELPCTKCPQRTGAKNSLFEDFHEDQNDRCLNPECFQLKTDNHVRVTRDAATAKVRTELNCASDYKITILSWNNSGKPILQKIFPGESILTDDDYVNLYSSECPGMSPAIYLDSGRFGNIQNICIDRSCPKHGSKNGDGSKLGSDEKERVERLRRKQEIFDVKVGEAVRLKTLQAAAEKFNRDNYVWEYEKSWRYLLANRLWKRLDDNARKAVTEALGRPEYSIETGLKTTASIIEYFSTKFTPTELSRFFFLCVVANEGEMLYGSWKDQSGIVAIAEEFEVDYKKLDAGERLIQAPKKFIPEAQEYFNKVERGEECEKPIFYKPE